MLVHGPGVMSLQLAGVRLCLKPRACHLPHQMQSKQGAAQRSWFCVLLAANGCRCRTRSHKLKVLLFNWASSPLRAGSKVWCDQCCSSDNTC